MIIFSFRGDLSKSCLFIFQNFIKQILVVFKFDVLMSEAKLRRKTQSNITSSPQYPLLPTEDLHQMVLKLMEKET